jgi:hypothetical protein
MEQMRRERVRTGSPTGPAIEAGPSVGAGDVGETAAPGNLVFAGCRAIHTNYVIL